MSTTKLLELYSNIKCVGEANDLSLFRGLSADLFVISDLYNIYPEKVLLDKLEYCFQKLEKNIDRCKSYNFGYGLCGILYTLALLTKNGFIDTNKTLYNKYEPAIMSCVSECSKLKYYDLLFGLIGYGHYYLELSVLDEGKRQNVWYIIEKLISLMINDGRWSYWEFLLGKTKYDGKGNRVALLSFLHGFPSVIAFLYLCKTNGFSDAEIDNCIKNGVDTIRNCIHDYRFNSVPEYLVDFNGRYDIKNYWPMPTYYCRGDFGVLNLLYELGDDMYNESFKEMLAKSFRILPESKDSRYCFCHGIAGSIYFLKKFNYLDSKTYALVSEYIESLVSYLEDKSSNIKQGILTGYIGMIMPLLLQEGSNTNFERLLLLSLNNRI